MFGFNAEFSTRLSRNFNDANPVDHRQELFSTILKHRALRKEEQIIKMASNQINSVILRNQFNRQKKISMRGEFVQILEGNSCQKDIYRLALLFFGFYCEETHNDIFKAFHVEVLSNAGLFVSQMLSSDSPHLIGRLIILELDTFSRTQTSQHLTLVLNLINSNLYFVYPEQFGSILMFCLERGIFRSINSILGENMSSSVFTRMLQIIKLFFSPQLSIVREMLYYFVRDMLSSFNRGLERLLISMMNLGFLETHIENLHSAFSRVFAESPNAEIYQNYNLAVKILLSGKIDKYKIFKDYVEAHVAILLGLNEIMTQSKDIKSDFTEFLVCVKSFVQNLDTFSNLLRVEDLDLFATIFYAIKQINQNIEVNLTIFEDSEFTNFVTIMGMNQFHQFIDLFSNQFIIRWSLLDMYSCETSKYILISAFAIHAYLNSILLDCEVPNDLLKSLLEWSKEAIRYYILCSLNSLDRHKLIGIFGMTFGHVLPTQLPPCLFLVRDIYLRTLRMQTCFDWSLDDIFKTQPSVSDLITQGSNLPHYVLKFNHTVNYPVNFLLNIIALAPKIYPFSLRISVFKLSLKSHVNRAKITVNRRDMYQHAFSLFVENQLAFFQHVPFIVFVNEAGMEEYGADEGGLMREFLLNILEFAFGPSSPFFVEGRGSDRSLYPDPLSSFSHSLLNYQFIGVMAAWAISLDVAVHGVRLSPVFWQQIICEVEEPLGINWLKLIDRDLYWNLVSLRSIEDVASLNLNFTIYMETDGGIIQRLLKTDGEDVMVTNDNLEEYIVLYAEFKLFKSVFRQICAFRDGFRRVITVSQLSMFDAEEFQAIFGGNSNEFDFVDFRANTVYQDEFDESSTLIKWFWSIFNTFSTKEARNFLKFSTSYSSAPRGGFKNLSPKFCIIVHAHSSDKHLPSASTCYNTFCLPLYSSLEIMREKLYYIINENIGFELC